MKNTFLKFSFGISIAAAIFPCTGMPESRLKIGAVLALSGTGADFGSDLRRGMELCAPNGTELVFEDSQGNPATGLAAFKKLVDTEHVNVGVVSFSGVANAVLPVAVSYRVPVILTIVSS